MSNADLKESPETERPKRGLDGRLAHVPYKWIALSNTTLGVFMASLDGSIVLIALPAIFNGIGINPLAPGETDYLLWTIMGYLVVTATLLVTVGRISDMFGRVRLYNLGFAIFAVGSILLFLTPGKGNAAALQIVIYRIIQAVGGSFLFANSAAILTDAFPEKERGTAMGINQIAMLIGQFLGLVIGGILASIDYRAVFLVSVPFSVGGTIWAYLALHETGTIQKHQRIDVPGNILFALGLTSLLVGATYGLQPYGGSSMGWTSPFVLACLIGGAGALVAFIVVEHRVKQPMFKLDLFSIRLFLSGNLANLLAALARGGLNFMLIIWLQGIWLPLHGYSFADTPLWAGIYMLPLSGGFLLTGPISGHLSDRYGSRFFMVTGMLVTAVGFIGLMLIPVNFAYPVMAFLLLITGMGMGMFAAPNTTSIMNSVPPEHRGVSSGMRATFMNMATTLSITMIFTVVTIGLAAHLPSALYQGLTQAGIPPASAQQVSNLPPTVALFAAFLGYNPLGSLLGSNIINALPPADQALILGKEYFPNILSVPFKSGLVFAFLISAIMSVLAALVSLTRDRRAVPAESAVAPADPAPADPPDEQKKE